MKKEYLKPEMMISLFDTKDVITDSVTGLNEKPSADIGDTGASSGISIPYDELN